MTSVTATPDPATGSVLLDVEQTQLRDLFTRVVASGWGNATTGQAWTLGGGAAGDYAVNGTQGTMTFSSTATSRRMSAVVGTSDMGFHAQCTIAVTALTAAIQPGIMIRFTDSSNYYLAELTINPSNTVELRLRKVVLGVITTIGSAVTLGQTHAAGATWNLMADVCGAHLRVKAWRSTVSEPDWLIEADDFDLPTGTGLGPRSILATGNTNGSTVFAYDNAVAWISQPVRLYRVTPDGVASEVRGSPFNTFQPTAAAATAIATVWDNEAPLDTSLIYRLTSACNSAAVVTGGPATLLGSGGGWIRDPLDPSVNIFIDFKDTQFNDCDATLRVEWLGWDPRVSRNASGVFDVVNAARPLTTSMTRKRYESAFYFATKTLDDVDKMEAIFARGRILLVSLPTEYGFGRPYGTDYITVSDLVEANADTNDFGTPFRTWEVPFQLSLAPPDTSEGLTGSNGIGGGGATYADMTASAIGITYATTTATGLTYQQLAQGVGY